MDLVDEMAAARWRQQRIWGVQTSVLNLEITRQTNEGNLPEGVGIASRTALAFTALALSENTLALLARYETNFSRMHDRARKALARMREEFKLRIDPNPAKPAKPEPPEPAPQAPPKAENRPPDPPLPQSNPQTKPGIDSKSSHPTAEIFTLTAYLENRQNHFNALPGILISPAPPNA